MEVAIQKKGSDLRVTYVRLRDIMWHNPMLAESVCLKLFAFPV